MKTFRSLWAAFLILLFAASLVTTTLVCANDVTIGEIIAFFDESVEIGTLYGAGPGSSAELRLKALRNMIEAAGNMIDEGYYEEAIQQLMDAYERCDGDPMPPDFVEGEAASTLASMILELKADLLDGSDIDGDGVTVLEGDCNDNDSSIYPGNPDPIIGDGIDQNCDGYDECYQDLDGDSFGSSIIIASSVGFCDPNSGYAVNTGDCDDINANINPDAVEICDVIDNDCDGLTDNDDPDITAGDPGITGATKYYLDQDVDGDGNALLEGKFLCYPQDAYTSLTNTDCDDTNPQRSGQFLEICDYVDNDCDSVIDEGFDSDGDGYTPCGTDAIIGNGDLLEDCNDSLSNVYPGAVEICDGSDNDCDGSVDEGCP